MKDKVFFDTNLIVYLFDKSEKDKHAKIKEIIRETKDKYISCISSQVINEFIYATTKKIENPIPFEKERDVLHTIKDLFMVFPLDFDTSMLAVDIKIRYKFSYWDSLIIASSLENNCSFLYSEDMQDDQFIEDNLQIKNPFL